MCKCSEHDTGRSDSRLSQCRRGQEDSSSQSWYISLVLGVTYCNSQALKVYWSVSFVVTICRWGVEWRLQLLAPAEILLSSHNEGSGSPWKQSKIHGPGSQSLWQGFTMRWHGRHIRWWAIQETGPTWKCWDKFPAGSMAQPRAVWEIVSDEHEKGMWSPVRGVLECSAGDQNGLQDRD